jgi:hypothetical protein
MTRLAAAAIPPATMENSRSVATGLSTFAVCVGTVSRSRASHGRPSRPRRQLTRGHRHRLVQPRTRLCGQPLRELAEHARSRLPDRPPDCLWIHSGMLEQRGACEPEAIRRERQPGEPATHHHNEPCASRVDPFGAMAASSSWPRIRLRRYRASASVLKPCACSSTPAMPNVLVTDPGFSTRRCHPSSCSRPSAPRTRHVCSVGSMAVTVPVSTRVERSDAASGIAACRGSSTPPATSGSSGRYSMWSAGSTRTISSWPANLRSSARAQWNPVNPAATTTTRGRPELLLSLVAAARVAITGDLLLRGQVRGHDGGRPPSSSGQRCGRSRLPRRRVQAQLRAGWFHRRPPCGRSPTLCRSRCAG